LIVVTPEGSEAAGRNTSSPSSEEIKPKPFSRLNHLTRPVGITHSSLSALRSALNSSNYMPSHAALPAALKDSYFILFLPILAQLFLGRRSARKLLKPGD
jgi:hypothetical protein